MTAVTMDANPFRGSQEPVSPAATRCQPATAPDAEVRETPEILFEQLGRTVWRFLARAGVNRGDLDDATQDVFVVVVRRWEDFRGDSTPKTWVLGIAAFIARSYRKKEKKTRELLVDYSPTEAEPSPISEAFIEVLRPEDSLSAAARSQAGVFVNSVVEQLSHEERSLFLLVDLEGCSVPEVAPALGLSGRRAHTLLEKVRRKFEREIRRYHKMDGGRA